MICVEIASSRLSDRGPPAISSRRVEPSTRSMAMYETPRSDPMSWIVTMLGWLSEDADRASFSNRFRRSVSEASSAGRTLIATSRSNRASSARYTSPIPPAPSGARIA